jgi:hypothetical protein
MAPGVERGDQDSAAKSLVALKSELVAEKAAQEKAQSEAESLALVTGDLKKTADGLATQVPILEEKLKHLDNKVLDGLTEICAKELSLERTTKANEDYKSQSARLTKNLESKIISPFPPRACIFFNILLTPLRLIEFDAELNTLKAMVENVVALFYTNNPSLATCDPQLLDGLPTWSREVILANMKQPVHLTLEILKSLYPRDDFGCCLCGIRGDCY